MIIEIKDMPKQNIKKIDVHIEFNGERIISDVNVSPKVDNDSVPPNNAKTFDVPEEMLTSEF